MFQALNAYNLFILTLFGPIQVVLGLYSRVLHYSIVVQ
jgi:hypothetical protein